MDTIAFIHDLSWDDLPASVQNQARRCLLDTLGTAIGGREFQLSAIIHDFAALNYGGSDACLWLDGRPVSAPGAALAHGMTIDAFDIHDGYKPVKGHVGAAIIPALLASLSLARPAASSGRELLTALVVGYEIACRAGEALHATACDYHTSGAWNALGCAAVAARLMGLNHEQTRHAIGIAEYHGPRSQMMRCIDHPTMLKDGSGWGAMAGVSAALLAAAGFTGAPAITVEGDDVGRFWADLGETWLIEQQYFKPYPICYWAQVAVTGALSLQGAHALPVSEIDQIRVYTFHEAARLTVRHPKTTEEAQYSLPFPVAAALVHGELGAAQITGAGLRDPEVLALADRVKMVEEEAYNQAFPENYYGRVEIDTTTGATLETGKMITKWDASKGPPPDREIQEKFRRLAGAVLPLPRVKAIEEAVWDLESLDGLELLSLLTPPVTGFSPT